MMNLRAVLRAMSGAGLLFCASSAGGLFILIQISAVAAQDKKPEFEALARRSEPIPKVYLQHCHTGRVTLSDELLDRIFVTH